MNEMTTKLFHHSIGKNYSAILAGNKCCRRVRCHLQLEHLLFKVHIAWDRNPYITELLKCFKSWSRKVDCEFLLRRRFLKSWSDLLFLSKPLYLAKVLAKQKYSNKSDEWPRFKFIAVSICTGFSGFSLDVKSIFSHI